MHVEVTSYPQGTFQLLLHKQTLAHPCMPRTMDPHAAGLCTETLAAIYIESHIETHISVLVLKAYLRISPAKYVYLLLLLLLRSHLFLASSGITEDLVAESGSVASARDLDGRVKPRPYMQQTWQLSEWAFKGAICTLNDYRFAIINTSSSCPRQQGHVNFKLLFTKKEESEGGREV